MSLHRRNPRRDGNERPIIDVLEARGFSVTQISGKGVPDLIVGDGRTGKMWLVEVKQPKGCYKPAQNEWRIKWTGPPPVCLRSVDDALKFPNQEA